MKDTLQKTRDFMMAKVPETLLGALGIELTRLDKDCVEGRMPVDARTHQPMGLLHGGASVALAESLASIAGNLNLDSEKEYAVGLEINANHIKSARSGWVKGCANPIHIGKRTHVWTVEIHNEAGELVCISRCTLAVIARKG